MILLYLNRRFVLCGGAASDHQIPAWRLVLCLHYLPDRTQRVDDRRSCGVGREGCERLEDSLPVPRAGVAQRAPSRPNRPRRR